MRSKKRHLNPNPFQLPKSVAREVRDTVKAAAPGANERVKYIWLNLSKDDVESDRERSGRDHALALDEWLNIVDESAALGADSLFISVYTTLSGWPELWQLCRWAQETHQMLVAIHFYGGAMTESDLAELRKLDLTRTRLYVDREHLEQIRFVEKFGVSLFPGDGFDAGSTVECACSMPKDMVCVGVEGALYTCGLVLGKDEFKLGHASENRLDSVVRDNSLPHTIPAGLERDEWQCDGCPPLMEKRLSGEDGH